MLITFNLGYRVSHCYRIWAFKETERVFTDYVRLLIRLKLESSGWPASMETDAQKNEFIAECYTRFQIELNKDNVALNSGLRQVVKLLLNLLWG